MEMHYLLHVVQGSGLVVKLQEHCELHPSAWTPLLLPQEIGVAAQARHGVSIQGHILDDCCGTI